MLPKTLFLVRGLEPAKLVNSYYSYTLGTIGYSGEITMVFFSGLSPEEVIDFYKKSGKFNVADLDCLHGYYKNTCTSETESSLVYSSEIHYDYYHINVLPDNIGSRIEIRKFY